MDRCSCVSVGESLSRIEFISGTDCFQNTIKDDVSERQWKSLLQVNPSQAQEKPGQTLQATALVHDAYIRLVDVDKAQHWDSRRHFFAAAAEAMRRILVEQARRKLRIKHGGELHRVDLDHPDLIANLPPDELLLMNDAIDGLAAHDPIAAELVKLRYFAGLTIEESAESIGESRTTAYRHWTYARAWLIAQVQTTT